MVTPTKTSGTVVSGGVTSATALTGDAARRRRQTQRDVRQAERATYASEEEKRVAIWRAQNPKRYIVGEPVEQISVKTGKTTLTPLGQQMVRQAEQDAKTIALTHREETRQKMLARYPEPLTHREETRLRMLEQGSLKAQEMAAFAIKQKTRTPITTPIPTDKYSRTSQIRGQDISVPWYMALPKNTTRSNMISAIERGYPGANTTALTDHQITVLYGNVRAGIAQKKEQIKTENIDIKLSQEVMNFEKLFRDMAKDIRGLEVPFGEEGPVVVPRESIARMGELLGGVPASIEKIFRAPERVPDFAAAGAYGMTIGTAKAFKEDPIQTISDIALMFGLFHAAGKVGGGIKGGVTSATRGKIPASAIIEEAILKGESKFPSTGKSGVTADAAILEFIKSEKNIRTAIEAGKVEPPLTTRITGTGKKFLDDVVKTDGELSAWHAAPKGFPKTTTAQVGTSSTPGLHVAPSLSPHFFGVGGETALFGFGRRGKPTAISIQVESFQRIPGTSRKTSVEMNKFLMECNDALGPQGIAYITTKFEALSKKASVEYEAVLPPGTPIVRVGKPLEMMWEGKKIAVEQYKTVFSDAVKSDLKNITTIERLYSERAAKKVLVSPYDILKSSVASSSKLAPSYKSYSSSLSSSIGSSISAISSVISSSRVSYRPAYELYRPVSGRYKPSPSSTYSSVYSSSAASIIRSLESTIASVKPTPAVTIPTLYKIKVTPSKKKKRKVKKGVRSAFVRNPIPSLKMFIG
jgi:hypothetical protein